MPAAYQERASAGTAHTHAAISAGLDEVAEGPATRNNGKATISPKVPALPTQTTSILAAPRAASVRTATDTSASRASTAAPSHSGTEPSTMMAATPTPSRTRSATGSSTLPRVDT